MELTEKEIRELKFELGVPRIPKLPKFLKHFINIKNHIEIKKNNSKMRIGILNKDINSLISYKAGDVILFRPYTIEDHYGKYSWRELEKIVKLCTIETPSPWNKHSTYKTIVRVPINYIGYEINA